MVGISVGVKGGHHVFVLYILIDCISNFQFSFFANIFLFIHV